MYLNVFLYVSVCLKVYAFACFESAFMYFSVFSIVRLMCYVLCIFACACECVFVFVCSEGVFVFLFLSEHMYECVVCTRVSWRALGYYKNVFSTLLGVHFV